MALNRCTLNGKTGGGQTLTNKFINDISELSFDFKSGVLRAYRHGGNEEGQLSRDLGLDSITSVTVTVTSGIFNFSVFSS